MKVESRVKTSVEYAPDNPPTHVKFVNSEIVDMQINLSQDEAALLCIALGKLQLPLGDQPTRVASELLRLIEEKFLEVRDA